MRLELSSALERVILNKVAGRMSFRIDINITSSRDHNCFPKSRLHQGSIGGNVEISLLKMSLPIGVIDLLAPLS